MASQEAAIKNNLNDRARKVGQFDQLTTQDIDALIAFYDFTCLHCGTKPAKSLDHVKPLMSGGTNTFDNLQLLCTNCNKAKGDQEIDYRQGKVASVEALASLIPSKSYNKHDWDALRFEYVTGEMSLRDLAKSHNLVDSLLFKRSTVEGWERERKNYGSKLVAETKQEATKQGVSARVMILEAAQAALAEWAANETKTDTAQLAKILELAARVEGMELDKRTLTVKDWRDVATEQGSTPDELETYFASLDGADVSRVEDGAGAGRTD